MIKQPVKRKMTLKEKKLLKKLKVDT